MRNDDSYLDYIDLDSFVKWLLVSDYLGIKDSGGCNLYLYNSVNKSKKPTLGRFFYIFFRCPS